MNKWIKMMALTLVVAIGATGCGFLGFWGYTDADSLVSIASVAAEYSDEEIVAAMSKLEKEDLEETGTAKTLFEDTLVKTLPNGTVVTIEWILDDNDTPTDTEDDTLQVTRTHETWAGFSKVERISRPVKPEPEWTGWVDNVLTQIADIEVFVEGVKIMTGTMEATWNLVGSDVVLTAIEKEITRLDRNGTIVRTSITFDADGLQSKTQVRVRVAGDGEIIVHSFTFEEFEEDGEIYVKIIRDDGSYAIVRNRIDPRITEYYTSDDVLWAIVTETRNPEIQGHEIERQIFDEEGNLIDTRTVTVTYRFQGDEVVVVKTFEDGRELTVRIMEDENGYTVQRGRFTYQVVFTEDGVEIYDEDGNLLGIVVFLDDGTAKVIYPDGAEEILDV